MSVDSLESVKRIESSFKWKLREVKHSCQTIREALDDDQATWQDHKALEEEFQELRDIWRKYQSIVDNFKGESSDVNDEVEESMTKALDAYLPVKREAGSLLRLVQGQVYRTAIDSNDEGSEPETEDDEGSEPETEDEDTDSRGGA